MQLKKNASRTARKAFFKMAIFLAIGLVASRESAAKEWRGIIPLHSTRSEVERLIGQPATPHGSSYHLAEEIVYVGYSNGPCVGNGSWNVPKDVVLYIDVTPRVRPPLKDSNPNLSEYEKKPDPDMGDIKYYVNNKVGENIEVNEPDGLVRSFHYYPTAYDKNDQILRCPDRQPKEEIVHKGDLVGEFSDYWVQDTREMLDDVVAKSNFDPRATIYIVYSSKDDTSGKIRLFADLAKQHMVEHKIKAERIILMDDKVRNKGFVEVWFSPER